MKKEKWKEKIEQACKDAGTYQTYFDSVIDTLAQIMEIRDITHKQWVDEGSEPTVIHVNKAGEANSTKNPLLTLENDLNTQALAHWRELGLTIKAWQGMKNEIDNKQEISFESLLEGLK